MTTPRDTVSTSHTIPISQVKDMLGGAAQRNLDVEEVLRRADISPALLGSALSRVSLAQYTRLIRALRSQMHDEFLGLTGRPVPLGTFAYMCKNLIRCATLGEAMREGFLFSHLMVEDFVLRLSVSKGTARVRVVGTGPAHTRGSYGERVFMFLGMGLASWLVARRLPLQAVYYMPSQRDRDAYVKMLFQAPVVYQDQAIGFDFEARWLDLPIVQNEMSLREFLRQAPSSLLVRYRDQTSLTERIRRLLRRHLSGEMPTLEDVSSMFGITSQTLRRRLRDEGHTYQSLKDSLRCDAAIELLARPDLSLVQIATMVGFSEPSTFHRAFKKWTGLPPGEYRTRNQRDQLPA